MRKLLLVFFLIISPILCMQNQCEHRLSIYISSKNRENNIKQSRSVKMDLDGGITSLCRLSDTFRQGAEKIFGPLLFVYTLKKHIKKDEK